MIELFPYSKLEDVANFKNGKALEKALYKEGGLYPIFGSNGVINYSDEKRHDLPVVVIGRVGAYCGSIHYSSGPAWVTDNAIVAEGKDGVDIRFLYYLLMNLDLGRTAIGSAQPLITQAGLKVVKARTPPKEDQKAIASVLGALNDKIETNRRMNETLEEMARAIFKSWFVDFDPVRAKAEGKQPVHMDAETAALFPSSLGDDRLPEGWSIGTYGDAMTIYDSKRVPLSKRQREERKGDFPYYGAAALMDHIDDYLFDGVYLLMGEDGSVARNDGTPFLQYVWGQFWVNNHAHVLQGANGFSTEHLFCGLSSINMIPYVTGAVQPKLNQANMKRIPLVVPTQSILTVFSDSISSLFAKRRLNIDENQTLAELRDTLLPKLMSGEIRVKDAQQEVEAVA